MKSFLQNHDIEIYSTHNEEKFVIAEKFIRTLKKVNKHKTSASKKLHLDKLVDIVNKSNNTYHSTIKMKPVHVKSNSYINSSKELYEDTKFKIADFARIFKNSFAEGYTPNSSEEVFLIKKVKSTLLWTYVINDLEGEETVGLSYKKELQKTNHKEFRIEKLSKRKDDKLYVLNGKDTISQLITE